MATIAMRQADVNDADVRNAQRLLARHRRNDSGRCRSCGGRYPCVPQRIAESVLRTCAVRG